jgi:hypothetical protein
MFVFRVELNKLYYEHIYVQISRINIWLKKLEI